MHEPRIPTRCVQLDQARRRHGHRVDHVLRFLFEGDPLADRVVEDFAGLPAGRGRKMLERAIGEGIDRVADAPPSLVALFEQLDEVPLWVDWETIDRGGSLFLRTGPLGALVLGCYALPLAYTSAGGNKPLAFTGRLVERAVRRLGETARFLTETSRPGGLRRDAAGFEITVKVRMMHAQMRRLLLQSGRWDTQSWGAPINQADLAGTNLLFSIMLIDGLRRIGFRFSRREIDAAIQLWRYSGYLMGVHPDLLASSQEEVQRLRDLIFSTQLDPDDDSRTLVHALLRAGLEESGRLSAEQDNRVIRWLTTFKYGLSYALVGSTLADDLGYPKSIWRYFSRPLLFSMVLPAEIARMSVPGGAGLISRTATRAFHVLVQRALAGDSPTFEMPEALPAARHSSSSKGNRP